MKRKIGTESSFSAVLGIKVVSLGVEGAFPELRQSYLGWSHRMPWRTGEHSYLSDQSVGLPCFHRHDRLLLLVGTK